jgi:archaemetzincin
MATRRRLAVLAVGEMARDPGLVDWLADRLGERLGVATRRSRPLPLRPEWLDAGRGQYRSNAIVDAMVDRGPGRLGDRVVWALGVTEADLFAPDRDFVFGEATLGGAWALVSTARLADPGLEVAESGAGLRPRTLAAALHEIGHLAALPHCDRPSCLMAPAATTEAAARRSADFCPRCTEGFRAATGLDPTRSRR